MDILGCHPSILISSGHISNFIIKKNLFGEEISRKKLLRSCLVCITDSQHSRSLWYIRKILKQNRMRAFFIPDKFINFNIKDVDYNISLENKELNHVLQ